MEGRRGEERLGRRGIWYRISEVKVCVEVEMCKEKKIEKRCVMKWGVCGGVGEAE